MPITVDMETAAGQPHVLQFFAVEILVPDESPVLLLDGAGGDLTFAGRTFFGKSDQWGTWVTPGVLRNAVSDDAEHVQFSLYPPDADNALILVGPAMQGAPVSIWRGLINPTTGAVIADPELKWVGVVDVPMIHLGKTGITVSYDCASAEEAWFESDEGLGLNDASHQAIRPGELAFAFATGLGEKVYWGTVIPGATSLPGVQGVASRAISHFNAPIRK